MRKIITTGVAAVIAAGAVLATAGSANAQPYRYYGGHHHHHGGNGDAVAAAIVGGVAGLALGAALSNGNRGGGYYSNGYYSSGYYDQGPRYSYNPRYDAYYGGGYAYRTCVSRDRVWDPYIGRRVVIERRYAC